MGSDAEFIIKYTTFMQVFKLIYPSTLIISYLGSKLQTVNVRLFSVYLISIYTGFTHYKEALV